jgi:chromosome segregation ATPase
MSRLDIAAQRFNQALDALEDATDSLTGLRGESTGVKSKIAALSEERERLLARIAELEDENRSLAGITEEVEERLDGAIGEIRAALGR